MPSSGKSAAAMPCDGRPLRYYFFEDGLQEACQPSPAQGERRKGRVCQAAPLAAGETAALDRADFYTWNSRPVCICTRRRDIDGRQSWSLRQRTAFIAARMGAGKYRPGSAKPGHSQSSAAGSRRIAAFFTMQAPTRPVTRTAALGMLRAG
jgi:hypothetical protein